jgi:hypothetical protein
MKFLQELVRFNRLDDDQEDDLPDDDMLDGEFSDELPAEDDFDAAFGDASPTEEPDGEDEFGDAPDELGDEEGLVGDEEGLEDMPEEEPAEPEDPDRAGLIRTVNKAHLVYKRSTDDGTYEEMWMYNVTNLRDEMSVRKAILSGTDIPPNKSQSPDGSQSYELWTAGNAEMMLIKGLPQ